MAITATEQTNIMRLIVGMFDAAPGAVYLDQITSAFEANGHNLTALAGNLSQTGAFHSIYNEALTPAQFATSFLTTLGLQGNADANAFIVARVNAGESRGQVILEAVTALSNTSDPTFASAKALLANRVAVATYYSITENQSSLDLATLQAVLVDVTADPASVTTVEAAILAAVQAATGQTFHLTEFVDNITGTTGNDTIISDVKAGIIPIFPIFTLNDFDAVNGGDGNDTFILNDTVSSITGGGTLTLPTAVTISAVENLIVNHSDFNNDGVMADVQGWAGLNKVTISQAATLGNEGNITVLTKGNVTNVAVTGAAGVTVTDNATVDTLTTVSSSGNTGAITVTSDALTNLNLTNEASNATVVAAAGTRTLSVGLSGVTGGTITDATATTVGLTTSGATSSNVSLTAVSAVTLNVAGATKLTLNALDQTALKTIDASADTGGVVVTPTIGNGITFTGGAGKDTITVGATTKLIAMGAGDDTVNLTAGTTALGTGGNISGGDGTDTLGMAAADAATASATATFAAQIDSFEKLKLGAVATGVTNTVDLSKLDAINYVISAGTGAATPGTAEVQTVAISGTLNGSNTASLTVDGTTVSYANTGGADNATAVASTLAGLMQTALGGAYTVGSATNTITVTQVSNFHDIAPSSFGSTDVSMSANVNTTSNGVAPLVSTLALTKMVSGGTFELTGTNTGAVTIDVTGAAASTTDVFNVVLKSAAALTGGSISIPSVETVNITTSNTDTTVPLPSVTDTLTLVDAAAKTIVVAGNAGLNLTFTGTALTSFDASAVTKGAVTWTTGALAAAATITGSATQANTVDFHSATKAVTYTGGSGVDIVTANNANNTISTGAGNDTVNLGSGNNTVDLGAGNDTINLGVGMSVVTGGAGSDFYEVFTNPNGNTYNTVTDFAATDVLSLYGTGASTFNTTGITLAGTAAFQDFLDAATAGTDAGTNNVVSWFQYLGNTYVVEDRSDATTFQNGGDVVIKLSGLIDLSTAVWVDGTGDLTMA